MCWNSIPHSPFFRPLLVRRNYTAHSSSLVAFSFLSSLGPLHWNNCYFKDKTQGKMKWIKSPGSEFDTFDESWKYIFGDVGSSVTFCTDSGFNQCVSVCVWFCCMELVITNRTDKPELHFHPHSRKAIVWHRSVCHPSLWRVSQLKNSLVYIYCTGWFHYGTADIS